MASSRFDAYKSSNRIDPKIKRRLRRSEEWSNKREEEVNKRRNLGPMSPCRELDVDLSMDSSLLEATGITPAPQKNNVEDNKTSKTRPSTPKLPKNNVRGKVETKTKQKNGKASTDAGLERLKMLQKWKEEKELRKKQEMLERAKNKPFVVSSKCNAAGKSNFERSWEHEQLKKTTKKRQVVPEAPPLRTTRAGTASARSAASSQRTTRQTTSAAKQAAAPPTRAQAPSTRAQAPPNRAQAPPTRAQATKAAPASRTVSTTRATRTTSTAAPRKNLPKSVPAEPVRRSTRASTKSDVKDLPSTKSRSTRNQKQKVDVKPTATEAEPDLLEEPLKEREDAVIGTKNDKTKSKSVSFAPENFVFSAPEDLESFDPTDFQSASITLSPTSAHGFFSNSCDHIPVDVFRSSNSPQLKKDFVTTRGSTLFKDETEASVTDAETCKVVQEDEEGSNIGEFSSPTSSGKKSNSPSVDENVDVSSDTPEQNVVTESVVEKNVSVGEQESTAPNEESCEVTATPIRVTRSSLFKTPVSEGPMTRRRTRRSMSETRVKPAKENRRRRKTETTRAPQSPEEWVELLKSSPMIEMTRRKYRKERLSSVPLNLQFDDDDLIAANIISPRDSPSHKVGEKLPEQASQGEMESSEKIVAITESTIEEVESSEEIVAVTESTPEEVESSEKIVAVTESTSEEVESSEKIVAVTESTSEEVESSEKIVAVTESTSEEVESSEKIVAVTESIPENIPEVESVEVSPVEPSVYFQPEQAAANAEDKMSEMPIESPQKEIETSEKIVTDKESTSESGPEVASEVFPVELPVDSQSEQTATNMEDESVEMPIGSPPKETESSENIVAITESIPESSSAVESVEPSVDSQPEQTAANSEDKTVEIPTETPSTIVKHDVAYFRNLIKSQTDTLNSFADQFEAVIPDVSEEVEGQIRAVVGKTKLLINKRFRQFIGYIDNCEYKTGEKETTCDDLQGFWDMVDFQVEDVRTKFEELVKLKENNWQPLETNPPVVKKPVKKLVKKAKPSAPKVNERKGKSKFALFMAQKKKEVKESELKVSSPDPQSKTEPDLKVFDAVFFKVESPVKSPKPHCEEIPKSPLVMPTFVETDRTVRLSPTTTTISIGEEKKMDSPEKAVCPEKEPPKMEPKSQSSANAYSPTASPLLPTKSLRRSFIPAIPSPLLQDITPNKRGRRSQKSFVFTDIDSPKMTVRVPDQKPEEEMDQEPAEKIMVLQTPPPRRSGRMRTPVASYSSKPTVNKTPSQDAIMQSFIKNLLSSESSSEGSQTPKDEENSCMQSSEFAPLINGSDIKKSTPRQKDRRRKTVEPQVTDASPKRRRSTRLCRKSMSSYEEQTVSDAKENDAVPIKIDLLQSPEDCKSKRGSRKTKSVAFSDQVSTVAIDDSPSTVLCPVSPNVDTTEEQQEELIRKSGRFQTLKVGFTPVRSRPSPQCTPRRGSKIEVESGTDLMDSTP